MSKFKENFNFITNIIILLILVFGTIGYSVGFHFPYEILPGQFANGNYSFNGSLGVGVSNPGRPLDVDGAIQSSGSWSVFHGAPSANYNESPVTTFHLRHKYNVGGSYTDGAEIQLAKTNTINGDYGSDIRFITRENGQSATEKVRIDSRGNVGVGTPNPTEKLTVNGSIFATGVISTNSAIIIGKGTYLYIPASDGRNCRIAAYITSCPTGWKPMHSLDNSYLLCAECAV